MEIVQKTSRLDILLNEIGWKGKKEIDAEEVSGILSEVVKDKVSFDQVKAKILEMARTRSRQGDVFRAVVDLLESSFPQFKDKEVDDHLAENDAALKWLQELADQQQ